RPDRQPHRRPRPRCPGRRGHARRTEAPDPQRSRPALLPRPRRAEPRSLGTRRGVTRHRPPRPAGPDRWHPEVARGPSRLARPARGPGRTGHRADGEPRRRLRRPDRPPSRRTGQPIMSTLTYTVRDAGTMLRRDVRHSLRYPAMTISGMTVPIFFLL